MAMALGLGLGVPLSFLALGFVSFLFRRGREQGTMRFPEKNSEVSPTALQIPPALTQTNDPNLQERTHEIEGRRVPELSTLREYEPFEVA